ncbi:histone acetyltransferase 1 [Marasmius crinis-equi]|uniref:Histone acetyltransferase type B catalytic subunit n=1 Tax=Marasmius crinis-equi TaxID=585013 RepID=A0ABR3FPL4_9AGAR
MAEKLTDRPEWTESSTESLFLSMVRAPEDKRALGEDETYEDFHPTFTYPIYGEDETVYGYKGLRIDLKFTSGSLMNFLSAKWEDKLEAKTVDNVAQTLLEFLPPDVERDEAAFQKRVEEDALNFKPIGQPVYTYTRPSPRSKGKGKHTFEGNLLHPESEDAVVYEVYHARRDTPGFWDYHRRMQIFILLYIEAGSYIQEDEEAWDFFVLYEKRKRVDASQAQTYHFVGYSSLYNFYHYPEMTRLRLSQFVIIQPYQRSAHGSELYKAIYNYAVSHPHIGELTVEDPAEAFEDLRDKNDLKMLLSNEAFMKEAFGEDAVSHGGGRVGKVGKALKPKKGKIGPPVEKGWAEKWRVKLKIAGRQFSRLIEMLIQMHLDPLDVRAMKAYRLQVKERLYRFNFEALMQVEKEERLEHLQQTFEAVEQDYRRLIDLVK